MVYALAENIRIRRWMQGKAICFFTDREKPYELDEDEAELLKRCDGRTEMERTILTDRLEAFRIICRWQEGKEVDTSQQWTEYQNYYIPALNWEIKGRSEEFALTDANKLLDEAKACGIPNIRLTGESIYHPHIVTVMQEIHDRGMTVYELLADAASLTRELLSDIRNCNPHAWIKILFAGIASPGIESEEQMLQAIRLCREMGFRVCVDIRVNRDNADRMFLLYQTISEMGVGKISIVREEDDSRGTLSLKEYYDFTLRFAKQYKESGSTFPVFIRQSLFLNGAKKNFCCMTVKKPTGDCYKDSLMCSEIFGKIIVQADGNVAACSVYGKAFALQGIFPGNVHKTSLKELFARGPLVDVLTTKTEEKLKKSETCAACSYVKYCQGGCPALAVLTGQSMFAPDETKCVFFRQGYYEKYCECMSGWNNVSMNVSLLAGL